MSIIVGSPKSHNNTRHFVVCSLFLQTTTTMLTAYSKKNLRTSVASRNIGAYNKRTSFAPDIGASRRTSMANERTSMANDSDIGADSGFRVKERTSVAFGRGDSDIGADSGFRVNERTSVAPSSLIKRQRKVSTQLKLQWKWWIGMERKCLLGDC